MNNQEIFDKVATHLLTQNAKSGNVLDCRYRSDDGKQCAVGCLIKDEYYDARFEGKRPHWKPVAKAIKLSIDYDVPSNGADILNHLQNLHDMCPVEKWPERLRDVAKLWQLKPDAVEHAARETAKKVVEEVVCPLATFQPK